MTLDTQLQSLISRYIHAKDSNKPHLMNKTFSDSAELDMVVKTEAITFPQKTFGQTSITDLLVKEFNLNYHNVYTFCVNNSINKNQQQLSNLWLVAMTDSKTNFHKVGCGRYDWSFNSQKEIKEISKLIITIEHMEIFDAQLENTIFNELAQCSYPWIDNGELLRALPSLPRLGAIKNHLKTS